ncbi:pyridoxal 5'-phosphate synthase glutaminase subunit PdxT [Clostridium aciditolerans]|uniref:Pyridoxal 5'-phosphate synthase subunit PdxT n=1 Tax=Clostridium aciditolerans TaxID=339861 RepID=A0A934I1Q4_9CLOT|nr:pyridoxal 5'-phosphate synthase glutaminase subunit PdxT [Clostridium aciditolerans]MBI6874703.1 pyridoxal 5'-phosphate synthase glutaminase subunit PdxT [Clostridium aciditolerans]
MKIGVLSIQGGVREHINHVKALGADAVEIKKLEDLQGIDGLILPGGESTAIGKILRERNLLNPLKEKIILGLPVWGTCAGMILLAKEIDSEDITHLSVMDIKVRRNAYGRQIDSFETEAAIEGITQEPIPLVFIRAPYIVGVGDKVKILHKLNGNIVAAVQDNILVTSFHPELTKDLKFHKYFLELCNKPNISCTNIC